MQKQIIERYYNTLILIIKYYRTFKYDLKHNHITKEKFEMEKEKFITVRNILYTRSIRLLRFLNEQGIYPLIRLKCLL